MIVIVKLTKSSNMTARGIPYLTSRVPYFIFLPGWCPHQPGTIFGYFNIPSLIASLTALLRVFTSSLNRIAVI